MLRKEIERLKPYEIDYLGVRSLCGLKDDDSTVTDFIDALFGRAEKAEAANAKLKGEVEETKSKLEATVQDMDQSFPNAEHQALLSMTVTERDALRKEVERLVFEGKQWESKYDSEKVLRARDEAALVDARDLMKIALKDACCISLLIPESSTSAVDKLKDTAKYIRKVIDCLSAINRAEPEKGDPS